MAEDFGVLQHLAVCDQFAKLRIIDEMVMCAVHLARAGLAGNPSDGYFGKTLSFVRKTERMSVQQAEEFIENECVVFEETKPYVFDRWGT